MNFTDMYNAAAQGASPYYNDYLNENMTVNAVLAQFGGSLYGRTVVEIGYGGFSFRKLGNLAMGGIAIAAAYFNQAAGGNRQNTALVATIAAMNISLSARSASIRFQTDQVVQELRSQNEEIENLQKAS